MEAVGVATSVILLISAANAGAQAINKLTRLSSSVTTSNSRMETLRVRVMTERTRLDEWSNNVAINKTDIDPSRLGMVEDLRKKIMIAEKKIAIRLDRYTHGEAGSTTQRLATRYKWENGAYDDAKDLVDLMHAVNDALHTLVPPLPSYPGAATASVATNFEDSSMVAVAPILDAPHEFMTTGQESNQQQIKILWQASRDAANCLGNQDLPTDQAFLSIRQHLNVWGSGLLDDPKSELDDMLGASMCQPFRTYILSQLIEILVVEEYLLVQRELESDADKKGQLGRCRAETRIALIGDGITQPAIERWYLLSKEQTMAPSSMQDHIKYLQSMIEVLFNVLPAIRTLRQRELLEIERRQREHETKVPATATVPEVTSFNAEDVQLNLEGTESTYSTPMIAKLPYPQDESTKDVATIDLIESNIDNIRMIALQSPVIEKSRLQLEEFSVEASLRRDLARRVENPEVRKIQEAIAAKFASFEMSSDPKDPGTFHVSPGDQKEIERLIHVAVSQLNSQLRSVAA